MTSTTTGQGDTALITGGSSGIGAGLAAALHARGATVVIAGRDQDRLDQIAAHHPGMLTQILDVSDPTSIRTAAAAVTDRHGPLTLLVNNAGVQRLVDFTAPDPPAAHDIAAEIDTNLTGLITVTAAFLPALRDAPRARLVHVSSALALVPLAQAPVYSATKAAVHSFTISLRHQLRGSTVQVVELIPPVVRTGLHRDQARQPPRAMELDAFTHAAMKGLDSGRDEIAVGLARALRVGSRAAPRRFFGIVNRPT